MLLRIRNNLYKKKAFSLIELMISCMIIGVLAGLAVPAYMTQRLRAEEQKAIATLHAYAQAQKAYWFDHAGTDIDPNTYTNVIDDLTSYVRVLAGSHDDGDWSYSVTGDAASFTVLAEHLDRFGARDGLQLQIDQTGSITRIGAWPY